MAEQDKVKVLSCDRIGDKVKMRVHFPQGLYDELKSLAEERNESISEVVAKMIENHVEADR